MMLLSRRCRRRTWAAQICSSSQRRGGSGAKAGETLAFVGCVLFVFLCMIYIRMDFFARRPSLVGWRPSILEAFFLSSIFINFYLRPSLFVCLLVQFPV